MPTTYLFKWISFFTSIVTIKESVAVYHGYTWSEVKLNQSKVPTTRVHALTWVDNNEMLWLYGGKSISNTTNNLNDLWKFDTKKLKWYPVINANNSGIPSNNLVCFCAGLVFVVQGYSDKSVLHQKIWIYNSSTNSWHVRNLPWKMKDGAKRHLALWCNHNIVTLLTNPNNTILYLWYYNTTSGKWNHMALNGTEQYTNMLSKTTSGTSYVTWNANNTKYLYFWTTEFFNNSITSILSIHHSKFKSYHILGPQPGCREKFMHWGDLAGNLWMVGGKICNSSQLCSDQWMLDISMLRWVPVSIKIPTPFPRAGSLTWEDGNAIWLYGGSARKGNGSVVVLHDLWVSQPNKRVVPLNPNHHLPGDSLGLSMTDKLIISCLVLLAVMTISVRLCYKRELNQILSKLRRRRVPYHQLSQEGDKSSRL